MYLTGLVIVIGAEVNAEIEHASPWGKDPGEKVPGQRRKIGAAAERAYAARPGKGKRPPAPVPPPVPAFSNPPAVATASPAAWRRTGVTDWLLAWALHVVWPRLRRRT
jgi:membrane protein